MNKSLIGLIGASLLTFVGVYLRMNSVEMAGAGSFDIVKMKEAAISQVAITLMTVGALLFVVTYIHWLFAKKSDK